MNALDVILELHTELGILGRMANGQEDGDWVIIAVSPNDSFTAIGVRARNPDVIECGWRDGNSNGQDLNFHLAAPDSLSKIKGIMRNVHQLPSQPDG